MKLYLVISLVAIISFGCASCINIKVTPWSQGVSSGDTHYGNFNINYKSFDRLTVHGRLKASNISVSKSAKVNGSAFVKDSSFSSLNVTGRAKLKNSSVEKDLFVCGFAEIKGGKYLSIILKGKEFSLENIVAKSIKVLPNEPSGSKSQVLVLKNCKIEDIEFVSNNGEIKKDLTTNITGKISGINVIKKKI